MTLKRGRKGRRGPVNAVKVTYDGVKFASGLEKYTYIALKKAGLFEGYENEKFMLEPEFTFPNVSWEKQVNGKGNYVDRGSGKLVRQRTYTPDFCGKDYIIECKGRANSRFPVTYKDFKKYLKINKDTRALYKPTNQKDVEKTILIILENRRNG